MFDAVHNFLPSPQKEIPLISKTNQHLYIISFQTKPTQLGAGFSATCLRPVLQDKLQETMQSVTYLITYTTIARQIAEAVTENGIEF